MIATRHVFRTRLSTQDCLDKLRESTKPVPAFHLNLYTLPREETVYGTISGSRFRLAVLRPNDWHNSLMPCFYGSLLEREDGTEIVGTLRPHSLALWFLVVWFTVLAGMAAFLAWAAVTGRGHFSWHPVAAICPMLLMAGCGLLFMKCGLFIGRGQGQALLRFVGDVLEAKPLP